MKKISSKMAHKNLTKKDSLKNLIIIKKREKDRVNDLIQKELILIGDMRERYIKHCDATTYISRRIAWKHQKRRSYLYVV